MRLAYGFALLAMLTVPSLLVAGCFDAVNDCERNANLPCYAEAAGGGSSVSERCDPLLNEGAAVEADCGVFVNPSAAAGGDGTQGSPFAKIAEALAGAPSKTIYVCATGGELSEAVIATGSVQLIGGVRCDDWKAAGTRTPWTAASGEIPLLLSATTAGLVQSFDIVAKPGVGAQPATGQGDSSIAVIADRATATFVEVGMTAGAGYAGGQGATPVDDQAPGSQDSNSTFDGNQGQSCSLGGGGASKTAPSGGCPSSGGTSVGGSGGSTRATVFGSGGSPDPSLGDPNGEGAASCTTGAQKGEAGHDGPDGNPGAGGTTAATFSSSGYTGDPGKPGEDGKVGQGGGGGAARPGGNGVCVGMNGYGGGSGGAGGCGGFGGGGGGAGGASIALISIESTLVLVRVTLTAAIGGDGGGGGDLQEGGEGGAGGPGGAGSKDACDGGDGGDGGRGASGGGGAGGPSLGIAFTGTAPQYDDGAATFSLPSAAAKGGPGGNGNQALNGGADGLLAQTQGF
jgi:hypothetical protein